MSDSEEERVKAEARMRLRGLNPDGVFLDEYIDDEIFRIGPLFYGEVLRDSIKGMLKEGGFEIVIGTPASKQPPEMEAYLKKLKKEIVDRYNRKEDAKSKGSE